MTATQFAKPYTSEVPTKLFRLRVMEGTHTQDELFLLSDKDLAQYVESVTSLHQLDIPKGMTRIQTCQFLRARGFGLEKTYYRGQDFTYYLDLAKRWPGKIGRLSGDNVPDNMRPIPGETIQEFAARMTALAQAASQSQGITKPTEDPQYPEVTTDGGLPPLPPSELPVAFETMNVSQLKEYAADREIDIEGATTKKEIISVLRGRAASAVMIS